MPDRPPQTLPQERLGIVSYTNVAPLHWQLKPWQGCSFVHGVPRQLNALVLAGDIDLTLMSSVAFLQHRHQLKALPDFSISCLGAVQSVLLFHWKPWQELAGARIALTDHSASSVALLQWLLADDGLQVSYQRTAQQLDRMLATHDAALIIGDDALRERYLARAIEGRRPFVTDLGMAWYRKTSLPFVFAVWATRRERPPSATMLAKLREARAQGIGNLGAICQQEAPKLGVSPTFLQRYLHNFRYYLEPPDQDALQRIGQAMITDFHPDNIAYWDA